MARPQSRRWLTLGTALVLAVLLVYAFWPGPTPVDTGPVRLGPMVKTLDEEGRTRVRQPYVVAAPVDGRLLRVALEAGDEVVAGETLLARLLPAAPGLLDRRRREQALAGVAAAEAALGVARAERERARAELALAEAELVRGTRLHEQGAVTAAGLDAARRAARVARATLDSAGAALRLREAELAQARAQLLEADAGGGTDQQPLALIAPVSGRVLQLLQKSETVLAAGTPIMELGDPEGDLEVVVELLSTDAVQVVPGMGVIIDHWGGPAPLAGVVERVEPRGFTKFSALGVEEQRVNAVIRFAGEPARRRSLGHGYRVEARIVVWQEEAALIAPSSALFRDGERWAVLVVEGRRARLTPVRVGHDNGVEAQILAGLEAGQRLVLYPAPGLEDGARVRPRED